MKNKRQPRIRTPGNQPKVSPPARPRPPSTRTRPQVKPEFSTNRTKDILADIQRELEQYQHDYADLFDFAPVGYVVLHPNGCIQNLNLTSTSLLGLDRATLVGHPLFHFVAPSERRRFLNCISRMRGGQRRVVTELTVIPRGQPPVPVQAIFERGDRDSVARNQIRVALIDVSERKLAEQALRESQTVLQRAYEDLEERVRLRTTELTQANAALVSERQRFRNVLNMLPAYVILLSPDYRVPFANRFFEERFGKANGRRCYEFLFNRTEPCENCESFKVLESKAPQQWEWTGPDGRRYEIHDFPFTDVDGSPLVMEVGLDISERRAAEREQQRLREELGRISRITSVAQLAASLAHELNQPLGAITCNVQAIQLLLTQKRPNQDDVQAALKDIEADSQRAGAVIHQLRRLYQKTDRTMTAISLNQVVKSTLDLLHSEFVLKDVTLQMDLDPKLPSVRANEIELQQVVLNLVRNALDAMANSPPGASRLLIHTATDGPGWVGLSIRDFGPGILEDAKEHLFEPFYTTKSNGMGMGLTICRSIIDAHEGRLWAENHPEGGATFQFILPAFATTL
jgi:PAS domain S-box-containing protein